MLAHRVIFTQQRLLRADDRVLLGAHAAGGLVALGPLAQDELELAVQVSAEEHPDQSALDRRIVSTRHIGRAIRHAAAQQATAIGLAGDGGAARVHAANMRTHRAAQADGIVGRHRIGLAGGVVEAVAQRRAGFRQRRIGRLRQRCAVAPAAHQLGRQPFAAHAVARTGLVEQAFEPDHVLRHDAQRTEAGVLGQARAEATQRISAAVDIGVARAEQKLTHPRSWLHVGLAGWRTQDRQAGLRQPVLVAEVHITPINAVWPGQGIGGPGHHLAHTVRGHPLPQGGGLACQLARIFGVQRQHQAHRVVGPAQTPVNRIARTGVTVQGRCIRVFRPRHKGRKRRLEGRVVGRAQAQFAQASDRQAHGQHVSRRDVRRPGCAMADLRQAVRATE